MAKQLSISQRFYDEDRGIHSVQPESKPTKAHLQRMLAHAREHGHAETAARIERELAKAT